jgi:hypothetical protein
LRRKPNCTSTSGERLFLHVDSISHNSSQSMVLSETIKPWIR